MKQLLFTLLLLVVALPQAYAAEWKLEDVPNVQLADSTRYVTDPDNIIDDATEARLNQSLQRLRRATSAEMVVVALSDIDSRYSIDDYATRLFNNWGVGKADKDNGVLVLLALNRREATIRTGKGVEGMLPDIIAGRIMRNNMIPRFKEGDYAGGLEAGANEITRILTDPAYAEEIHSSQPDRRGHSGEDDTDELFKLWLYGSGALAVGLLGFVLWKLVATRREDSVTRYRALERYNMPALLLTFLGLGMPVIGWLVLHVALRRLRNKPHICSHCHVAMRKLDEATDNQYLQPWQDMEERLNSVDYDVWLCPECGATDVVPFVNKSSAYTTCPRCHARTQALLSDHTVEAPTPLRSGRGVKTYSCRNCGYRDERFYDIPKIVVVPPRAVTAEAAALAAAVSAVADSVAAAQWAAVPPDDGKP